MYIRPFYFCVKTETQTAQQHRLLLNSLYFEYVSLCFHSSTQLEYFSVTGVCQFVEVSLSCLFLIGQPGFKEPQEEQLRPAVVVRQAGGHFLLGGVGGGGFTGQPTPDQFRTSSQVCIPLTRSQSKQSPRLSSCSRMAWMLLQGATESCHARMQRKKRHNTEEEEDEEEQRNGQEKRRRGRAWSTFWSTPLGPGPSRWLRSLQEVRKRPNPSGSAPRVGGQRPEPGSDHWFDSKSNQSADLDWISFRRYVTSTTHQPNFACFLLFFYIV